MKGIIGTLLLLVSVQVDAALITWEFTGTMSNLNDSGGHLDASLYVGSAMNGLITFDSDIPDRNPLDQRIGAYMQSIDDGARFEAELGNYIFNVGGGGITPGHDVSITNKTDALITSDDFTVDGAGAALNFTNGVDSFSDIGFVFTLRDNDGTVFSDDSLPLLPPDITEFENHRMKLLIFSDGDRMDIDIDITSLFSKTIPEPTTISLLGLGLIGLVLRRKKA